MTHYNAEAKRIIDTFYIPIMQANYPNAAQYKVAIQCAIIAVQMLIDETIGLPAHEEYEVILNQLKSI